MEIKKLTDKKVLVTGGAGFIGSELVRQLSLCGANIIVLDNLINGKKENLAGLNEKQVKLIIGDIRDESLLKKLIEGVDIIFHLACLGVRHSIHSPVENHEVNATGTLKLLMNAKTAGVKKFVHVSTSEVYGTARIVPMNESHPTFPTTIYGASKLAGECYSRAFYNTYQFPTVIVRPFNSFGPRCHHEGDSGEVIPKFILRMLAGKDIVIFGDGSQTRDFTFVSDTARGILLSGIKEEAVGKTINLGSGYEITINELSKVVSKVVGKDDIKIKYEPQRPGDTLRLYSDNSVAKKILGFESETDLKDGLMKLKEWYLSLNISPSQLLEQELVHNWKMDKQQNGKK